MRFLLDDRHIIIHDTRFLYDNDRGRCNKGPRRTAYLRGFAGEFAKEIIHAFLIEVPNITPEQGAAVLRELGLTNRPAEGQILHIEGPAEGGVYRVVDVWESQEIFMSFVQEKLGPAFARVGISLPADMQPKAVWPVTTVLK